MPGSEPWVSGWTARYVPMPPESVPHCSGRNSNICRPMIAKSAGCVAYLCWRASRTSALSSRSVVARLLPERRWSFTSPGFSLCLLSILYTVLCDICIVWAMCDTVAPAAFIPMTCHRWLMVLFPITKSNWPVTKSWRLGWVKLC